MKILYDYQIFKRQIYGGVSRYFYQIINGFRKIGISKIELVIKYSNNIYLRNDKFFD